MLKSDSERRQPREGGARVFSETKSSKSNVEFTVVAKEDDVLAAGLIDPRAARMVFDESQDACL